MEKYYQKISEELNIKLWQTQACAELLSEEATVPFIARYRKEKTGSLDEVEVTSIRDRLSQLKELNDRRLAILNSLTERELLTDKLNKEILEAETLTKLEDIYLPHRPKRRTRALIAKEKGLEPLALLIMQQDKNLNPSQEAEKYFTAENNITTALEALQGARDILAEIINEESTAREKIRKLFSEKSTIKSKLISEDEEKSLKYKDYFEWEENLANIPSHRLLAMRRGENEAILTLSIIPNEEEALNILKDLFLKNKSDSAEEFEKAIIDGYKRLMAPSMETEVRLNSKKQADLEAINIFSQNLNQLLLAPPVGAKIILAIDPGFRTGCKVVVLSKEGDLLEYETIQPHASEKAKKEAQTSILTLCQKYKVEIIAIGNGTAGRETESFIKNIDNLNKTIPVVLVNESGASIYSASEIAREEFPDLDLTIRGAISIGRRLMDPLAELVKIDPKSIGVGQYQHDVNQNNLKQSLDDVVVSCVNKVGVEANMASEQLLAYVSGLGPNLAKNFIKYRQDNGSFKSRKDFLKVPRLGPKAFEQCAGFLRIQTSKNPLDTSAVHPESYKIVESMATDLKLTVEDLIIEENLKSKVNLEKYVTEKVGLPTLSDIINELEKPGRDPRAEFKVFSFQEGLEKPSDLEKGMRIIGIVTNVTAFGAFVDVGVHQDGLVHISEMADTFVKDPHQILKVQQEVMVTVIDLDLKRNRISLSLKTQFSEKKPEPSSKNTQASNKNVNKTIKAMPETPFAVLKKLIK